MAPISGSVELLFQLRRPAVVAALSVVAFAPSARAQTPAPAVGLGFGVDTTQTDVGPIVRLVRAYLAAPDSVARSPELWDGAGAASAADHTHDDLAARYALQGFPASIIGVLPTDAGDSLYTVKLLYARAERTGGPVSPLALERLYAVRAPDRPFGWRLAAALPRLTRTWPTHAAGRITFHYAPGQRPDTARARRAARFVDSVARLFGVRPPVRIDYYTAGSPDAYFRALGLDFFVLPSGPREAAAGNALPDAGVLLAGDPEQGEIYRHELVHVALGGRVRSGVINEGVAVWLGGSRGQRPPQLYRQLVAFQRAHPAVTFTALMRDKRSVPQDAAASSDPWYATGALVCEAVYRRGGAAGLRALADAPADVGAVQHVLAGLLGLTDEPVTLDHWWRTAADAAYARTREAQPIAP